MKLETILQAAVNSMVHGHHEPHCFSGDKTQLERSAQSEIDNIGFSDHYAEPGYDDPKKAILFANWNKFPRELDAILEKLGYAVEWSDEWSFCEDCNGAVRTSPDSYGWTRSYVIYNDCELFCTDCVKKDLDEYETHLLNKYSSADTLNINWESRGFVKFNKDHYENGFHPGQNDKPKDIIKKLPKDHDYLFAIPSVGQFDVMFDCWIKPKSEED